MTKLKQNIIETTSEKKPASVDLNAPFICFDSIPAIGAKDGLFNIMLASSRPSLTTDRQVLNVTIVRAQVQCSLKGLQLLRAATEKLLLLATATKGLPS
jgi:hypothetical protein